MEKNSNISYESLMPADMRSSWQENVEAEVDDIVESIQTSLLKIPPLVALQLRSLWKTSHLLLFCDPLQSRKYMYQFMKSSQNENIILPENITLLLCQSCYITQIPQHTCTYKTVKRKYKKVRQHEESSSLSIKNRYRHNLIRTCLLCQHTTKSLCHETIKKKSNTENILKTPKSLTYTPTSSSAISSTSSTKFSFLHSTYNNSNTNTLEKSITKLTTTSSNNTNNNMIKSGNSLSGNFISLKSPTTGQNLSKKFASILSSPLSATSTLNIKNNSDNNTPNGGKVSLLELEKSTKKKKRSLLKSNNSESIINTSNTEETTDHLNMSYNTDDMNIVPSNNGDMDNSDYQNKEITSKSSESITTPNTKNNPIIYDNINSDQFTGINIVLDTIGSPLKKARISNVNKNDKNNGYDDTIDRCSNNNTCTSPIITHISTNTTMDDNSTGGDGDSGSSSSILKHSTINLSHIISSSNNIQSSSNTLIKENSDTKLNASSSTTATANSTVVEIKPKINIQYANRLTKFIVKSNEYHDRMNQISTINTTTPTTNTTTTTTTTTTDSSMSNDTNKVLSNEIDIKSNQILSTSTEISSLIDNQDSNINMSLSNILIKQPVTVIKQPVTVSEVKDNGSRSNSRSGSSSSSSGMLEEINLTSSSMTMKDLLPQTKRKKTVLYNTFDPLAMTTTTANITSSTTTTSRNTVVSSSLFKSAGLFNKVISDIASNKSTTLLNDTSSQSDDSQINLKLPDSVTHHSKQHITNPTALNINSISTENNNVDCSDSNNNKDTTDLCSEKAIICNQTETARIIPHNMNKDNIIINKVKSNLKSPPNKLLSSALRSTIQSNKISTTSTIASITTDTSSVLSPLPVVKETIQISKLDVTTPTNTLHTTNNTMKINGNIDDNKKKNTTMKANIPKNIKNNPLATIRKHLQSK